MLKKEEPNLKEVVNEVIILLEENNMVQRTDYLVGRLEDSRNGKTIEYVTITLRQKGNKHIIDRLKERGWKKEEVYEATGDLLYEDKVQSGPSERRLILKKELNNDVHTQEDISDEELLEALWHWRIEDKLGWKFCSDILKRDYKVDLTPDQVRYRFQRAVKKHN